MKLLIEVYGQLLSMDFAAIDALKTAITKAMDTPPRAKVAEASVVGIIQARFLGLCLVIKAANQQITIQAEDVPILQAALNAIPPKTGRTQKTALNPPCGFLRLKMGFW